MRIEPEPGKSEKAIACADKIWDREWAHLCAQNPKMFNGPILAVTRLALDEGTIWCVRDTYRRLALRDELGIDIAILSVTTVLEARDESGKRHVLVGRRGELTRTYPGFWELGPAGGLDAPVLDCDTLGYVDVMAQINAELGDETGIREFVREGNIVAVVFDPHAGSYDIVVRTMLDRPIEQLDRSSPDEPWEYSETRWLSMDEVGPFLSQEGEQIIGPTRVLLGWLPS